MIDWDEAARSAGEGGKRRRERAREAGPPRREEGWTPEEGGQRILEGLRRQECIGALVHSVCTALSNAGGDLDLGLGLGLGLRYGHGYGYGHSQG